MSSGVPRAGGRTAETAVSLKTTGARRALRRPSAAVGILLVLAFAWGCESRKVIKARPVSPTSTIESGDPTLPAREAPQLDPETEPSVDAPTCGIDGLPECPLQYWMDHRLSGPLSRQDYATVARSFRDLANAEPPGYAGWRLWAQGGAAAADREDTIGVRRACSGCHDTYRERYRRTIRARPMQIVDPP
ncbi:MAG TPA: hypothetical protein VGG33_27850 [Polyangia bacterium]